MADNTGVYPQNKISLFGPGVPTEIGSITYRPDIYNILYRYMYTMSPNKRGKSVTAN